MKGHLLACALAGGTFLLASAAAAQPAPVPPGPPPGPLPGAAQPVPGPAPNAGQPPPGVGQPIPPNGAQPPTGFPGGVPPQGMPGGPAPGAPPNQGMPGPPPGAPGSPNQFPGQPLPFGPGPGVPGQAPPPGQPFMGPGGSPDPWQSAPPPGGQAPPVIEEEGPGTAHGIPFSKRGRIGIEAAGFTRASGDASVVALGLDVHFPVAHRTFIDARLPIGDYFPGNIMLGADRVSKLDPRGFLAYGLQIGLPLVTNRQLVAFALPNGTWNQHEYKANFMPIKVGFGYERMFGQLVTGRLDLEPILSIPIGNHGYNAGFTFQHALEVQIGHSIGGGVRLQGVAVTDQLSKDPYQFSIEPFLMLSRHLGYARLGLLMPLADNDSGPAFKQAWGLRLWAGLHID